MIDILTHRNKTYTHIYLYCLDKMAKLILFFICFMIYYTFEINASCSENQFPKFIGNPLIEQVDARKVKISVSTSLQNRECADLILIKYWPSNSPLPPYRLKLIKGRYLNVSDFSHIASDIQIVLEFNTFSSRYRKEKILKCVSENNLRLENF